MLYYFPEKDGTYVNCLRSSIDTNQVDLSTKVESQNFNVFVHNAVVSHADTNKLVIQQGAFSREVPVVIQVIENDGIDLVLFKHQYVRCVADKVRRKDEVRRIRLNGKHYRITSATDVRVLSSPDVYLTLDLSQVGRLTLVLRSYGEGI